MRKENFSLHLIVAKKYGKHFYYPDCTTSQTILDLMQSCSGKKRLAFSQANIDLMTKETDWNLQIEEVKNERTHSK